MEAYTYVLKSFAEGNTLIMQWAKAMAERDWETLAFLTKNYDELEKMIANYEGLMLMV
jgi:hypothetical protein